MSILYGLQDHFKKISIYSAFPGLSCSMQDLLVVPTWDQVPWSEIETWAPSLGMQSLRLWTTWEVPAGPLSGSPQGSSWTSVIIKATCRDSYLIGNLILSEDLTLSFLIITIIPHREWGLTKITCEVSHSQFRFRLLLSFSLQFRG